jgi:hypothetical protein
MKGFPFSSGGGSLLRLCNPACPEPSRCPYCPVDAPMHWIHWGSYQRYAGDPQDPRKRVDVTRYWCKIVRRTFSLPPDALLPYCGIRTGYLLQGLYGLFVKAIALNTLARRAGLARGTLRDMKARFLRVLPTLRLPPREGALRAAAFLAMLSDMEPSAVADIFRDWKEREPKHSIVGIYLRC